MKCIFGPVNSRRLGRSLGIDLFSDKICNLNCVYCEVGCTVSPVDQRAVYTPTQEILAEIENFCSDARRLDRVDVLTVTAKGEPTLHSALGEILRFIKRRTQKPVAVLTNGTTLMDREVRRALKAADIVVPSLDSARPESFRQVDRPVTGMNLAEVIEGLTLFSHEFTGKIWLETLFVRDINDAPEDVAALLSVFRLMRIDRLQLNTVVRPPAENFARPVSKERLEAIARSFQNALALPVDGPFTTPADQVAPAQPAAEQNTPGMAAPEAILEEILQMLRRRPCTAADIDRTFQLGGPDKVEQLLEPLVNSGTLQSQDHGNNRYYQQLL
jgi:wyosine [tRNA(Phe)-imidazoG37] synthetase (radical SAM superfamily)